VSDAPELEDRPRPRKSAQAFRTISEAADQLSVPQHVLRFWETKFTQLKPLKRGGGRRYYRPEDLALLKRISDLLYTQGYTIKGVQRLLAEGEPELPLAGELGEEATDEQALAEVVAELHAISVALKQL